MTEQTFAQPEIKADLEFRIPMGRIATVDDMLGAVVFLASSAASMVTGQFKGFAARGIKPLD